MFFLFWIKASFDIWIKIFKVNNKKKFIFIKFRMFYKEKVK